jgi:hypothetical protein
MVLEFKSVPLVHPRFADNHLNRATLGGRVFVCSFWHSDHNAWSMPALVLSTF